MEKNEHRTNFLFPKDSFISGMGSVLNIAGNYFDYNYSKTAKEADLRALKSDWKNVGDDIAASIKKFELNNEEEVCLK